jgi:hypothetical protein
LAREGNVHSVYNSKWIDRFASLHAPPINAAVREAISNRYTPFRAAKLCRTAEPPPFRAKSFIYLIGASGKIVKSH